MGGDGGRAWGFVGQGGETWHRKTGWKTPRRWFGFFPVLSTFLRPKGIIREGFLHSQVRQRQKHEICEALRDQIHKGTGGKRAPNACVGLPVSFVGAVRRTRRRGWALSS